MNALLRSYYAEFGYWFEAEILDINGKTFTSANQYSEWGEPLPATISGPVTLSNPRGLQIRLRNKSIRPGTFANLQFIVMYSGPRLPRYTKTCPLPAIGGEVVVNVDQIYGADAGTPEIWSPGVYSIYIGVYGILASGFQYGIGGINVLSAVNLLEQVAPPTYNPVLAILPSTVAQKGTIHYAFSGFPPNSAVGMWIQQIDGGRYSPTSTLSDAYGDGSGDLVITTDIPPGTYTLQAEDAWGNRASVTLTITAYIPPSVPLLTVQPAFVAQGGTIWYSFSGFPPNRAISMFIQGGQGWGVMSDAYGAGSGSLVIATTIPLGTYTLQAEDEYGNWATAMFTVTAAVPVPTTPEFKAGSFAISEYSK